MTLKDDPTNPVPGTLYEGLTKQEQFAAMLMAGLLASPHPIKHGDLEAVANTAVTGANFLIAVLNSRHHEKRTDQQHQNPTILIAIKSMSTEVIKADPPMVPQEPMLALVERAARDQTIDVEKMEKLLVMAERLQARKAEAEYDLAMNLAQSEMRPVANDSDNPQTRSRYASYGALDRAVRPIYTDHGFSLSFGTKSPSPDRVTVTCRISHRSGHTERVEIDMPADGKGAKGGDVMTKTHATGSAVSYGMRYLLKMIFNIAVGEYDDDGNAAGKQPSRTILHPPTA